ncbi:cytochrome P450 6B6-like isoform X2 [Melitaea cinxia]|uniref:cytochrome P450 6B6-like isoform X2 n=1 Tax=Melitaea cinxia TaxID=113334 RepID=UPI001E270C51|nr:cytochrome P450 6B6-like isoform X2 [Melitaea cinxia]
MITLALFVILICGLYLYGKRNHTYWESKGVKHDKPMPLFGNTARSFFAQTSITQQITEFYWKYPNEKVVGLYGASRPQMIIRDPEIAKKILISDFNYFYPRGLNNHRHQIEPLLRNIFFVDGDVWRLLRQRMTPAFTSGKLKAMFPLIVERAEKLQARALSAATTGTEIDARELMARYTTDFIGACGFGLQSDSLQEENSAFRKLGATIFYRSPKDIMVFILKEVFPSIFKSFKLLPAVEKQLIPLVNEVLRQRNYEPSSRNDFIDLLLECKKKGTIVGESIEKIKPDGKPEIATLEMDDELISAQVFVFFAAGFETSSSATSTTLHELAYHPEVQSKVHEEIDRVLAKYDNKLSYDAIKEMTYLEWTFKEGMRIFPSLGFLIRECARKYTFEDINLTIDEGVRVFIPLQAMHNDPKYFDNPSEFRPERFDPANFDANNKYVYLPFGIGPRACIGERLGLMQSLAGLAAILARFSVKPAPSTIRHPVVDPKSGIVQAVKGGLPLLFIERKP